MSNQKQYWDENLDAANLGSGVSDSAMSLLRELQFASAPDIQAMLDFVAPAVHNHESPQTQPRAPLILEIGCGLGANAVLLRRRDAAVVALDISHHRLAAMRQRIQQLPDGNELIAGIYPVKARAEALPFRDGALDGACSRAVLIHTDLPAACSESSRVLRPGAPVAFSEVMAHNPLVHLYRRTLAPKEWKHITNYFSEAEIQAVQSHFSRAGEQRFYYTSFLAFVFQYALHAPRCFAVLLKALWFFDRLCTRAFPRLRRYAWFVLITGNSPHR